jgi:hypothetical protein
MPDEDDAAALAVVSQVVVPRVEHVVVRKDAVDLPTSR